VEFTSLNRRNNNSLLTSIKMPLLSKHWWHPKTTKDLVEALASTPNEEPIGKGEESEALLLLQDEQAESDIWRKALETVQSEEKWDFLKALHLNDNDTLECVDAVCRKASELAKDTEDNERGFHLPGGKPYTYR